MRRLFVAIELPEAAKVALTAAQDSLRGDLPGARWVEPDGMHLTLKFLGPVENAAVDDIAAALEEAVREHKAYRFSVQGIGGFPTHTRPRVVWAGIKDGGHTAELAKPVEHSMERLGFKPEDRPFHPHITLARIKDPQRLDRPDLLLLAGRSLAINKLKAERMVLFESFLSPQGARYVAVHSFSLK